MNYSFSGKPLNINTLNVLGYLIVSNRQIHSYQLDLLNEYLDLIGISLQDTGLNAILDGCDESSSYSASISAFRQEELPVQTDIYYMLHMLSEVDSATDASERMIFRDIESSYKLSSDAAERTKLLARNDAAEIRSNKNVPFVRQKPNSNQKQNWLQRLFRWIVGIIKSIFGKKEKTQVEIEDEYKQAIEKCALVAKEDFEFISPIYEQIIQTSSKAVDEINFRKQSLSLETGAAAAVAKAIGDFSEQLNRNVLQANIKAQEALTQKERTVSDFTISLIGRTKAGKSTLHAILTNEGRDKIGSGKQRTTRYNRVYQWNYLRLIDTPGIGSPEAEGRLDDEIAASVLGESDIICFVIVDDSIQQDILESLEKVAFYNKPIVILLNHKENIRSEIKYKRFIENPLDWLQTDAESNLQGHIDRILNYAHEKGFDALIKVYPVFLLPALMSSESEYADDSDLLWDNSNIDVFMTQMKSWICEHGSIKRSQTLIDETVQEFTRAKDEIVKAKNSLIEEKRRWEVSRKLKIDGLKIAEKETYNRIEAILREKFSQLANVEALKFAEKEYSEKGDLSGKWTAYLKRIDFENDVADAVKCEIGNYVQKAEEIANSLFEDLYFSIASKFNLSGIEVPIQFDFKAALKITGSILGLAGTVFTIVCEIIGLSIPVVGWIVAGASALLGIGSTFLMSKEKRRQKDIDKIYEPLKEEIHKKTPEIIGEILDASQKKMNDVSQKVERLFLDLSDGLSKTMNVADQSLEDYEHQIGILNRRYAFRLLEFINQQLQNNSNMTTENIDSIDRSQKGLITIVTNDQINLTGEYSLDGVIAEKVFIKRRK